MVASDIAFGSDIVCFANSDMCPQARESDASYYAKHCFDDMQFVTDCMQAVWLDLLAQKPRYKPVNARLVVKNK